MSPQRRFILSAAAALILLGPSGLSAQHSHRRSGFWAGVALGWGSLATTCSSCSNDRQGAMTAIVKLGGTLSQQVLVGVESDVWSKTASSGLASAAGNVSISAFYYPRRWGGAFLRGGIGMAYVQPQGFEIETGFGAGVGAGYDLRFARGFSFTPVVNFNWGNPATNYSQNFFQIAAGLTWH